MCILLWLMESAQYNHLAWLIYNLQLIFDSFPLGSLARNAIPTQMKHVAFFYLYRSIINRRIVEHYFFFSHDAVNLCTVEISEVMTLLAKSTLPTALTTKSDSSSFDNA